MKRRHTAILIAPLTLLGVTLALSGPTATASGTSVPAAVTVSPALAWPGLPVTVSASGFAAGQHIDLTLDGVHFAKATAGPSGQLSVKATVPTLESPGVHRLTATAAGGTGRSASTTLIARLQWSQAGLYEAHRAANWIERSISKTTAPRLKAQATFAPVRDQEPEQGGFVLGKGVLVWGVGGGARAIDAVTGTLRWSIELDNTGAESLSGVAYDATSGLVYLSSAQDDYLFAVDITTGKQAWALRLPGNGGYQALTLSGGLLYLVAGNETVGGVQLMALDLASRSFRWQTPIESASVRNPVLYDGVIYTGFDELQALDSTTGQVLWSHPTAADGSYQANTLTADAAGLIVATSDGRTRLLDHNTGKQVWATDVRFPGGGANSVTSSNGLVFVTDYSTTDAYDEASGTLVWSKASHLSAGLAYANGLLYGGVNGTPAVGGVTLADAATGTVVATLPQTGFAYSQPIIADGKVYIPDSPISAYTLPATG